MVLLVQYYRDKNQARQEEIDYCLSRNATSGFFERIVCFCADDARPSSDLSVDIVPIPAALTFRRAFSHANDNFRGEICVLANSDIFFDRTIFQAESADLRFAALALTRWDVREREDPPVCQFFENPSSQDVWIFLAPIPLIAEDVSLGVPGCDNSVCYHLLNMGVEVWNPCFRIIVYHLHLSGQRNFSTLHATIPPHAWLPFSNWLPGEARSRLAEQFEPRGDAPVDPHRQESHFLMPLNRVTGSGRRQGDTHDRKDRVVIVGSVVANCPVAISDTRERLLEYLCSVLSWVDDPGTDEIVYIDTGGFDLRSHKLARRAGNKRLSFMSLDLSAEARAFGKGRPEIRAVAAATVGVSRFYKITGRLYVRNFDEIRCHLAAQQQIAMNDRRLGTPIFVDTRFYRCTRAFLEMRLMKHLDEYTDEVETGYIESVFGRRIESEPVIAITPKPIYVGRDATSGERYDAAYPEQILAEATELAEEYDRAFKHLDRKCY